VFAVCVVKRNIYIILKILFKYSKKSLQLIEIKYIIEYIYVIIYNIYINIYENMNI